jgi:ubiquinone/menaquinone biosynthesis C-methylase UbiE
MKTEAERKQIVKDKYSEIAQQDKYVNQASCCGAGEASTKVYNIMTDDYSALEGYTETADLGLGCGLPTQFAHIQTGDVVVDLGSGAGNDAFVARHETGPTGKVIGIDFSEAMIQKARSNAEKLGHHNVEFRAGDIEHMPVNDATADVIVSNCVLNLVPNKKAVIREIYRSLKPGGHFSISDIVLVGELPAALRNDAEMYAGCVAGAIQKADYLGYIQEAGFENITLQKEKPIEIPDDILSRYLEETELTRFKQGHTGIFSVTVFAQKPSQPGEKPRVNIANRSDNKGCAPNSGCC